MLKYILNTALITATTITPFVALAGSDEGEYFHHGMMGGWGGMMMGPLMMIVVLALVVIVVVMILRWMGVIHPAKSKGDPAVEETALDILNKRFAKGEIDKQEFEEKRGILKS